MTERPDSPDPHKYDGTIELPPDSVKQIVALATHSDEIESRERVEELSRRIALAAEAQTAKAHGEPAVDPQFFFTPPQE